MVLEKKRLKLFICSSRNLEVTRGDLIAGWEGQQELRREGDRHTIGSWLDSFIPKRGCSDEQYNRVRPCKPLEGKGREKSS